MFAKPMMKKGKNPDSPASYLIYNKFKNSELKLYV